LGNVVDALQTNMRMFDPLGLLYTKCENDFAFAKAKPPLLMSPRLYAKDKKYLLSQLHTMVG